MELVQLFALIFFIFFCYALARLAPFIGAPPIKPGKSLSCHLTASPDRDELINHSEDFWRNNGVLLPGNGTITACAGQNTFVWRAPNGTPALICYDCAESIFKEAHPDLTDMEFAIGCGLHRIHFNANFRYGFSENGYYRLQNEPHEHGLPCEVCQTSDLHSP